jgi:hypothetical protein
MKRTIRTLGWRFNADRMVMDYTQKCYVPAAGYAPPEKKSNIKAPVRHPGTSFALGHTALKMPIDFIRHR